MVINRKFIVMIQRIHTEDRCLRRLENFASDVLPDRKTCLRKKEEIIAQKSLMLQHAKAGIRKRLVSLKNDG